MVNGNLGNTGIASTRLLQVFNSLLQGGRHELMPRSLEQQMLRIYNRFATIR